MGRRPQFRCLRPPTSSHSCELRIGSDCGNSVGTIGRLLAAYTDGLIQGLDRLFIAENADHPQSSQNKIQAVPLDPNFFIRVLLVLFDRELPSGATQHLNS
jgi:hypothetical protein